MIKTLVCSFPPLDQTRPPLSGAIIAAVCRKQGHECVTADLQFALNEFLTHRNIDTEFFNDVFYENQRSFNDDQEKLLIEFVNLQFEQLQVDTYDYILCSLFSYLAQPFAKIFLSQLRSKTASKIVIGGAGLVNLSMSTDLPFPEKLKNSGIIDQYITGEAEEALLQYFEQESGPGIGNNNFKQIEQLDIHPWPDYTYYNLDNYATDNQELVIIGSRGCVRKCTFCDVVKTSPKYRYRSGQNIAKEIIHHYETHGVTRYYFADSLVNGSYKAFDDMCNTLANYKFEQPISWSGQYIIRNQKTTPKNHFDLLRTSGCSTLFVGIESGSDRVRAELGKNFTNDDIEYYLENFAQNNISILFLMFSGYISETPEDYQEALTLFSRWQRFVATGTIQGIETLNILSILPGAPLEEIARQKNFLFLADHTGALNLRSWVDPARPEYDFKERVRGHIGMIQEAMKYKWPLWNGALSMRLYEQALKEFLNNEKKYIPIRQL